MAIVVILVLLFLGVIRRLPGVADRVACSSNLRSLHTGLESYIQDHQHWPKEPQFGPEARDQMGEWWIKTLEPYGIPAKSWHCPAILRLGEIQKTGRTPKIHYSPMIFDQKPRTPYKWPNTPWIVEIANVHGHGPLCILPDGSVRDWDKHITELSR